MLSWPAALTLRERLAALRASRIDSLHAENDLAERRLQRWKAEKVFAENPSLLAERLASDGTTEHELQSLLGISPSEFVNQFNELPEWASRLIEGCKGHPAADEIERAIRESQTVLGKSAGFVRAASGFIEQERKYFNERLAQINAPDGQLPFDPPAIEKVLLQHVIAQILALLNRTLVLELNVARIQEQLAGSTPAERFESFLERLRQAEVVAALWEEYPVLARQIILRLRQWADASLEFLQRLVADWQEIKRRLFPGSEPGLLIKLTGSGDRHHNGHGVLIAEFSSGAKLVYKPRPLDLDRHFQELLESVNALNPELSFRILNILPGSGYGWIEYINSEVCDCEAEVKHFYWRQGGFLALLYALRATDFHFENLVACGEWPVLVDLETLFQPSLYSSQEEDAAFLAHEEIADSVFRTGLLPFRFAANEEQQEGAEISGLGGAGGQKTPYPVAGWEGAATDAMRFIRKRIEIPPQRNRPRLRGAEISAFQFIQDIINGFASIYQLLQAHRGQLLAPDGPLARFAHDPVRCILRPTSAYSALLAESLHPNLLRDALDRDRFFDNLWADTEFNILLKPVIGQERSDLWEGDIPIFSTSPDSGCLYDSHHQPVEGHRHEPSFSLVEKRVRQLSHGDRDRQIWFIRAAMTALSMEEGGPQKSTAPASLREHPASREELLQAAIAIGDHLLQLAVPSPHGDVSWIGIDMVKEPFWELNVTGPNLYGGLSGIGLFFAYLAQITREERFARVARQITTSILRGIGKLKDMTQAPIGAFTGLGGAIYFLAHCGVLWNDQKLLSRTEETANSLSEAIANDKSFDVISGSAGLVAVLLTLQRLRPQGRMLELATQCGDHLLQNGQAASNGLGWITLSNSSAPLTGFSHGAAGIAWALMKLASVSGEKRFREAAIEALRYERNLFSRVHNNWPDLRDFVQKTDGKSYATAWCHGAAGIGLGRISMLENYQDDEIHGEIRTAIQATSARPFGASHCLCHGDLGNFETLLEGERILKDPKLAEIVRQYPAELLASLREHGWRCGVPLGVETPGLMVGTSGIGYGLLRLADPESVPSVLLLAPPLRGSS